MKKKVPESNNPAVGARELCALLVTRAFPMSPKYTPPQEYPNYREQFIQLFSQHEGCQKLGIDPEQIYQILHTNELPFDQLKELLNKLGKLANDEEWQEVTDFFKVLIKIKIAETDYDEYKVKIKYKKEAVESLKSFCTENAKKISENTLEESQKLLLALLTLLGKIDFIKENEFPLFSDLKKSLEVIFNVIKQSADSPEPVGNSASSNFNDGDNVDVYKKLQIVAQLFCSRCYEIGIGVKRNIEEAVKYCEIAAKNGHYVALNNLGACYTLGHVVDQNLQKALECFRKAAAEGYYAAQYNLGYCHGLNQNPAQMAVCYKSAAEQGCSDAQFDLAVCYLNGTGVAENDEEATKWLLKAANQDNADARLILAQIVLSHHLLSQDRLTMTSKMKEMAYLLQKSALQGNVNAQSIMWIFYKNVPTKPYPIMIAYCNILQYMSKFGLANDPAVQDNQLTQLASSINDELGKVIDKINNKSGDLTSQELLFLGLAFLHGFICKNEQGNFVKKENNLSQEEPSLYPVDQEEALSYFIKCYDQAKKNIKNNANYNVENDADYNVENDVIVFAQQNIIKVMANIVFSRLEDIEKCDGEMRNGFNAFLMGKHERLGEDSPIPLLNLDVLKVICDHYAGKKDSTIVGYGNRDLRNILGGDFIRDLCEKKSEQNNPKNNANNSKLIELIEKKLTHAINWELDVPRTSPANRNAGQSNSTMATSVGQSNSDENDMKQNTGSGR